MFWNLDWSTSSRVGVHSGALESVDGISLGRVLAEVGSPVFLMKIDIEGAVDAWMVTDFTNPVAAFEELSKQWPRERIVAPDILALPPDK